MVWNMEALWAGLLLVTISITAFTFLKPNTIFSRIFRPMSFSLSVLFSGFLITSYDAKADSTPRADVQMFFQLKRLFMRQLAKGFIYVIVHNPEWILYAILLLIFI